MAAATTEPGGHKSGREIEDRDEAADATATAHRARATREARFRVGERDPVLPCPHRPQPMQTEMLRMNPRRMEYPDRRPAAFGKMRRQERSSRACRAPERPGRA